MRHLAKVLLSLADELGSGDVLDAKTLLAGLHSRQGQQVLSETRHARRIFADDLEKFAGAAFRGFDVDEGLGVSLNGGKRRAQLVGNIGDEIAARLFNPL